MNRMPLVLTLVFLFACACLFGGCFETESVLRPIGEESAGNGSARRSDPAALPDSINAGNIHREDTDWHHIAVLVRDWQPAGEARPLPARTQGVLVRVEEGGTARIDFGRHGKHWVPVEATDIIERANRVRDGKLSKIGGVFTLGISNRLVDSRFEKPGPLPSAQIKSADAILCIFADPRDPGFASLARDLMPLEGDLGIRTLFVPQGVGRDDMDLVMSILQHTEWRVPFTYPGAAADYTELLLDSAPVNPHGLLVTPDGRVLYRSDLDEEANSMEIRRRVAQIDS
jgi:hypothetical protein